MKHTYDVETAGSSTPTSLSAEYYLIEDGFVTFKDEDHQQVASFNAERVLSVERKQSTGITISGDLSVSASSVAAGSKRGSVRA